MLQRVGVDVSRATAPLERASDATLLYLEPERPKAPLPGVKAPPDFSEEEVRALRAFVAAGGRLVLASRHTTALHRAFELKVVDEPPRARPPRDARLTATANARTWTRARTLQAHAAFHLNVSAADPRALFVDQESLDQRADARAAVVVRVAHGQGDVVFIGASSIASNAFVALADNLVFLADLVGAGLTTARMRGPVRFDESKHGEATGAGLAALLRRFDAGFAALQLVFAAVLFVAADARRRRRGPAVVPPQGAREQQEAIAALYQRGRLGAHCAHTLTQALVRAGAARFCGGHARTLDELATQLAQLGHVSLAQRVSAHGLQLARLGARPKARPLLSFARESAALQADFTPAHSRPAASTAREAPHRLARRDPS